MGRQYLARTAAPRHYVNWRCRQTTARDAAQLDALSDGTSSPCRARRRQAAQGFGQAFAFRRSGADGTARVMDAARREHAARGITMFEPVSERGGAFCRGQNRTEPRVSEIMGAVHTDR